MARAGACVSMMHRLYLSPGLFGFGELASYDYFGHVRRALEVRFREAGHTLTSQVANVLPTASVRRRAVTLAELVGQSCDDDSGPIHLLGHSTGGLDVRLVPSPSARLPVSPGTLRWLPRLRSVTTMNCPHYGTPLAKFFATVSGQRMLYALSALTFIGLSAGAPPLAYVSALAGLMGRSRFGLGLQANVVGRSVDSWLRRLDDVSSKEVHDYLEGIKRDQGAILQLTPEAMDLFQAGVEDRPGVAYQSTASMTPHASFGKWVRAFGHPRRALSMSLFAAVHAVTGLHDPRYPCHAVRAPGNGMVWAGEQAEALLARVLGSALDERASDGVVPLRSQVWGTLVWTGMADHLDVIGHYGEPGSAEGPAHSDWLTSGSSFDRPQFDALMDAVAAGMLRASRE